MAALPSRSIADLSLALGGALLVVGLAVLVSVDATDGFDRAIIEVVRAPSVHDLLSPLRLITEAGSTWAVTAVAIAVLILGAAIGMSRHGVIGALTITLASLANSGFKLLVARQRPELLEPVVLEHGFSFPSGHSALGMVAYGVVAVLVWRSTLPGAVRTASLVALGVVIGLIGLSRIYLGVHYPTDVLAGWTTGLVVVLVYAAVTRRVWPVPAEARARVDPAGPRSDRPATG
jgi:undecaprenyl-diphosphatase